MYTAVKEISHMLSIEDIAAGVEDNSKKSAGQVIALIVFMNLIFSFDSILSALAITKVFAVLAIAIIASGLAMLFMADQVSEFIKKNRNRQYFSLENLQEDGVSGKIAEILSSRKHSRRDILLRELQEKLNEALQKLSVKHRTAVVLYEIEGLSHKEIGQILKCSEGTVRSRLHYAKNELQNYMKDYLRQGFDGYNE